MTTVRLATPADRNAALHLVSALLTELGGNPPPADTMAPVFDALITDANAGFIVLGENDRPDDGDSPATGNSPDDSDSPDASDNPATSDSAPAANPVAVCTVSYLTALRTQGRYAIIQEMYVNPDARSTGIGMAVLQFGLAHAAAHGCHTVELGTPYSGQRQIEFYRRAGFTEVGARLRWRTA